MDLSKKIEILRKRNADLQLQLEESQTDSVRAKELSKELEYIKLKWNEELKTLSKRRQEYDDLISDLREVKQMLQSNIWKR